MESEVLETNTTATPLETPPRERTIGGVKVPARFLPVAGLLVALIAFPVLHLALDGSLNFYLHILFITFMHTTLASSWNIMGGYAGYISLGHNVFLAIGGYTAGLLLIYHDVPFYITAPLAGLIALGAGVLIGFITLRVRGPSFIIATIAMVLVVRIVLENWEYGGGTNGKSLPLLDLSVAWSKIPFYYAMLILAMLAVYLSYRIRHSKLGLGLRAISQDEIKAESAGIPTNRYKIIAFALSGFLIGSAGAVWAQYQTYITPHVFLLILIGAQMVLICILGGKGTVAGPVVGAALVVIVINELVLNQLGASELNIFITGLLMLLVLVFFPDGIVGSLRKMGRLPGFLDWD